MPAMPPTLAQLTDELERVSYYGIGHDMGDLGEEEIPSLAAIARRLGPDARGRLRVSIAQAVSKAVAELDPPKRILAAEKLLWLERGSDLEEDRSRKRKPLKERHREVAPLLGLKLSTYERRKKWRALYENVAAVLLRLLDGADPPVEPSLTDTLPPPQKSSDGTTWSTDTTASLLASLPEAAADLHFGALTALFVADFHNRLLQDRRLAVTRVLDWANAAECLFCAYCRFMARHAGLRGGYLTPFYLAPPGPNASLGLPTYLSPYTLHYLRQLWSLAKKSAPFAGLIQNAEVLSFGGHLDSGSRSRTFPGLFESIERYVQTSGAFADMTAPPRSTCDLYDEVWTPWFREQFTDEPVWPPPPNQPVARARLRPKSIELFAAIGENYATAAAARLDTPFPIMTSARHRAVRTIGTFYDIDDWRPLSSGHSLREYAESFFEKANRPASCQYRRTMLPLCRER